MSGLKYGKLYNYKVFAENAAGLSEPSNVIGPVLADDPHCTYPDKIKNNLWHEILFNVLL